MTDILSNKLLEGLKGPLKGNKFAMTLYSYVCRVQDVPTEGMIKGFIIANPLPFELHSYSEPSCKDWRFLNLFIKGIRRFPGDRYYTISFSSDYLKPCISKSCSSVFIGRNGVGKSSLFNGLEKIALGKLHSISFESFSSQDEQNYLRNVFTPSEDVSIILETKNGTIVSDGVKVLKGYLLPACFCSARDINNILRFGVTTDLISEQLGLQKYWKLIESLRVIHQEVVDNLGNYKSLQDSYEKTKKPEYVLAKCLENSKIDQQLITLLWAWRKFRKYKNNRLQVKKQNIRRWRDGIENILQHVGDEYRTVLKPYLSPENILDTNENVPHIVDDIDDKVSKLSSLFYKLIPTLDFNGDKPESLFQLMKKDDVEKYRRELDDLKNVIEDIEISHPIMEAPEEKIEDFIKTYRYLYDDLQHILHEFKEQSDDIFELLMKSYFGDDIGGIFMDESDNFSVKIIPVNPNKGEGDVVKNVFPQRYLNTFRFKLYCVALKLSLAFYAKRLHHSNYPVILDDVFDSSDFSNREKIKEFIAHVFEVHDKIFKSSHRIRDLQFIFFTQDEVISEAVYKGILSLKEHHAVKYSRIYNYIEAELDKNKVNTDLNTRTLNNKETEFVFIEDIINRSYES